MHLKRLYASLSVTVRLVLVLALVLVIILLGVSAVKLSPYINNYSASPINISITGKMLLLALVFGVLTCVLTLMYMQFLVRRIRRIQRQVDEGSIALRQTREHWYEGMAVSKRYEAALAFQNDHDHVTGLATLAMLSDRFNVASTAADHGGHPAWIVFVDIGNLKLVNTMLSHRAGDQVLRIISERLLSVVLKSDTVARIGGNEFVLLLPEGRSALLTETTMQHIIDAVVQPARIETQEFLLTCNIGIAVYPCDGQNIDALIKHSSIAMSSAKETGNNCFQFYSPAMNQRVIERARIAADLRNGLERGEFTLHYQPQVDLWTGRIIGMEALIRWQHPELGMLPPARFIGISEEMDLIGMIGMWVLRTACFQNMVWRKANIGNLRVAVNMSARQFYQADLVASVISILEETGLPADNLDIELTESLVMTDVECAIDILNKLQAIGVHISVDDFGTGYSSLSYLKRFPIDTLKIDQSFIRDITTDPDDAMIATAVISLAHSLHLKVIAEGVETESQLAFLRRHRCDQIQGFYFSHPLPSDAFEEMLLQHKCLPVQTNGSPVRQQTLLIVDDEHKVCAALQRLLRKESYLIVVASSAVEGLEAMALHNVQVILCDHRMPSMTGVEFFSKVKDLYPDTIRIMLTGYTEMQSVIDSINQGAVHQFFVKPWDGDILRSHIRHAFSQYWSQHGEEELLERVDISF